MKNSGVSQSKLRREKKERIQGKTCTWLVRLIVQTDRAPIQVNYQNICHRFLVYI